MFRMFPAGKLPGVAMQNSARFFGFDALGI